MNKEAHCNRYRRDGEPCLNTTDYVDGWCREPGCDGYLRRSTTSAPESVGAPSGTAKHLAFADSPRPAGVDPIQGDEVHVTLRATESFQFHHGGGRAAAETELRTMLEDFSLRGVARANDGERTWTQFKSGIPSRFGRKRTKPLSPGPPAGEPVVTEQADGILALVDVDALHFTGSAFGRGAQMMEAAGAGGDVEGFLRDALRRDLAAGPAVERSESGAHITSGATATWILWADLRSVLGARPV